MLPLIWKHFFMKLLIWLWNPGEKYTFTRHNLGFLFLEYFASKHSFSDFQYESKFKWQISQWNYNWEKILLLKPETYMNLSWESMIAVTQYYKISLENIMVIYDDMSMDFGKVRFRDTGSAGGHNWVKNIIKKYWENFKRVKVWIGQNELYEVSDWVLSKFTPDELIDLEPNVYDQVEKIIWEKL